MQQKFKVLHDQGNGLKAGTIVEMFYGPTYGLETSDSLATGEFHVAVLADEVGPFYTCKHADLEAI